MIGGSDAYPLPGPAVVVDHVHAPGEPDSDSRAGHAARLVPAGGPAGSAGGGIDARGRNPRTQPNFALGGRLLTSPEPPTAALPDSRDLRPIRVRGRATRAQRWTSGLAARSAICYDMSMTPKLSEEQRRVLTAQNGRPVPVEDDQTHKIYVLVDEDLHRRAMQALQEQEDLAAVREGIEQMEAGLGQPLEQADAEIRSELGFPPRR